MTLKSSIYFLTALLILSCKKENNSTVISFSEVTKEVGLITDKNWKYGGPTIADINNDGK